MENVLVTGANGFVGKNIVKNLIKDYIVIGCGRNDNKLRFDNYKFVKWDISDDIEPSSLSSERIDYIVHTAASLDTNNLSNELVKTNCCGTFNVFKFAVKHNVKLIIYISSLPIIGNFHSIPIAESNEFNPESIYHATKAAGELIINQLYHFGIKRVILRLPSPIGPGMPSKTILPIFIQKALKDDVITIMGNGTRKQNYLDVRDLSYVVFSIIKNNIIEGVFNVGSRNIISNKDLAKICICALKSGSKIKYEGIDINDNIDWTTNDLKLRSFIGEYQKYSLENSIIDIADAMVKNENSIF